MDELKAKDPIQEAVREAALRTTAPSEAPPEAPASTATETAPVSTSPDEPVDAEEIKQHAVAILKHTFDPEIPVNIYDLGLIYGIEVTPDGVIDLKMTLTSPMCPVAGTLPPEIQYKLMSISGVREAKVDVVWDPPWDKDMMTEAAKLQLGLM